MCFGCNTQKKQPALSKTLVLSIFLWKISAKFNITKHSAANKERSRTGWNTGHEVTDESGGTLKETEAVKKKKKQKKKSK